MFFMQPRDRVAARADTFDVHAVVTQTPLHEARESGVVFDDQQRPLRVGCRHASPPSRTTGVDGTDTIIKNSPRL
jgi:hypothetical protein